MWSSCVTDQNFTFILWSHSAWLRLTHESRLLGLGNPGNLGNLGNLGKVEKRKILCYSDAVADKDPEMGGHVQSDTSNVGKICLWFVLCFLCPLQVHPLLVVDVIVV